MVDFKFSLERPSLPRPDNRHIAFSWAIAAVLDDWSYSRSISSCYGLRAGGTKVSVQLAAFRARLFHGESRGCTLKTGVFKAVYVPKLKTDLKDRVCSLQVLRMEGAENGGAENGRVRV